MYILSPRNQFVVGFFSVFDCLCYFVTLFAISQILHYMYLTNFALSIIISQLSFLSFMKYLFMRE
jgi:hypothetical protein